MSSPVPFCGLILSCIYACVWHMFFHVCLIPARLSTNPSSFFLFCPEEEIVVLLQPILRPVKRLRLLLYLPLRLLVLDPRLDSASLSTQNALLNNFRGLGGGKK
jgi:hypothetical protein